MTPEQRDRKRKADRERMRLIKSAARGDATVETLTPVEEHRLKVQLKAERSKTVSVIKDLVTCQEALATITAVTSQPLPMVKRVELRSGLREATAVALLSDLHVEEKVRVGETPYPNEYNEDIAHRSLGRFFSSLRWMIDFHRYGAPGQRAFKIRNALLWLGGDLMTGHIHEELKENTSGPPIKTFLWLLPRLKSGIDLLLEDPQLETIDIPCSYGNHGRNTQKPYRALGAVHSYEWLLYQVLASMYVGEKRVRFLADESAHQYTKVYGFDLHFHHGDETNYNGGVGGITVPINKSVAQWDIAKKCHYHNFGHWHQYMDWGRVAVNGSMIGFNAYAMSIKAAPEEPQQSFYLLDSKRGKTCRLPIWVRDSEDVPRAKAA